jgi:hypothetical protein
LHLKLRHSHEDPDELKKAYEAAEEEIALTRRSGSTYQCALCPKTFNDNGAFYGHIQVFIEAEKAICTDALYIKFDSTKLKCKFSTS